MIMNKKRKLNTLGFTLTELLVVIAIMSILAGVSFVAVGKYIRNLQQLEMDNTAKDIFIAAQNHLSQVYASGEYDRLVEDGSLPDNYWGFELGSEKPQYLTAVSSDEGTSDESTSDTSIDILNPEYRYVLYNGFNKSSESEGFSDKAGVLSIMLPVFSIDEEISENGNYIIAYEANTATVMGVFYSGRPHTSFGSIRVHDFSDAEAKENGNTSLRDAVLDKTKRTHFLQDTEDSVIGCFIAGEKNIIPGYHTSDGKGSFKPLRLYVDNGSRLTATIVNPNTYSGSKQQITLTVKGITSDNSQTIVVKRDGNTNILTDNTSYANKIGPTTNPEELDYKSYTIDKAPDSAEEEKLTIILDDITSPNSHFTNLFPYMIPGEDIEIYAELSDSAYLVTPERSNVETTNSLFDGNDYHVAEISNIRHLENLDPTISNVAFKDDLPSGDFSDAIKEIEVNRASQIKDLVYSSDSGESFVQDITDTNGDGHVLPIYMNNTEGGTSGHTEKGYYGVYNEKLISYNGNGHSIDNLYAGASESAGIFRNVANDIETFTVKNLTVNNGTFKGTDTDSASAAIVAYSETDSENNEIVFQNITLHSDSGKGLKVLSGNDAGGLIGGTNKTIKIKNCYLDGNGIEIGTTSTSNADAGGFVGYGSSTISIDDSYVKSGDLIISAIKDVGCFIGSCDKAITINRSYVTENKKNDSNLENIKIYIISEKEDAGGLVGCARDSIVLTNCYVDGETLPVFEIIGSSSSDDGHAGGFIGYAESDVKVKIQNDNTAVDEPATRKNKSYVTGKNLSVQAYQAGGLAGYITGKIDIADTFATAYVYGEYRAGGFIGKTVSESGSIGSKISRCYASGHTIDGVYGGEVIYSDDKPDNTNYNVISGRYAGGFIGSSEGTVQIDSCYTTCSVYSKNSIEDEKGYTGGFIGSAKANLNVKNCYSAGRVGGAEGAVLGGFAGTGSITVGEGSSNYYLKGKDKNGADFNSFGPIGEGTLTGVSSTSGAEISPTTPNTSDSAVPWDTTLGTIYPYKTVAQMSGKTGAEDKAFKDHFGDWVVVTESESEVNSGKFIRNAEKLAIVFSGNEFENTDVSVLVEGLTSKKAYYALYNFNNGQVSQYKDEEVDSKIRSAGGSTTETIQVEGVDNLSPTKVDDDYLNYNVKEVDGGHEYYIFYDDITTPKHAFAKIFHYLTPGEDIRITAQAGVHSWGDLKRSQASAGGGAMSGITNSLFADGSNNGNYEEASYYSDINPYHAIVNPAADKTAYKNTALITDFRHLQNLDVAVSDVNDESGDENKYTIVKLCKDLYWKSSVKTASLDEVNIMPTEPDENGVSPVDFISAINNSKGITDPNNYQEVKIYGKDSDKEEDAIAVNNSFFGIRNPFITEFDGQKHSINNVVINPLCEFDVEGRKTDKIYAGLFRYHDTSKAANLYIHDFTLVEPVVYASKSDAGALIGYADMKNGNLTVERVYSYGKYSVVKSGGKEGNAGGLIGKAYNGAYDFTDCGASSYVYADEGKCAGGFIGDFKPKDTTNFNYCFAGGHVADNSVNSESYTYYPDYVNDKAVDTGTEVTHQGGYNVCAKVAAGGFFGYIGTHDNTTATTITSCFTTASVNSVGKISNAKVASKSAVGGFVGRLQPRNQKYNYCYATGRVYNNTDFYGGFAGHNYETTSHRPSFDHCYALQGEDYNYNGDSNFLIVNPSDSASGVTFVKRDSDEIINKHSSEVKVKTFNLSSVIGVSDDDIEYPFIDSAHYYDKDGQNCTVFYGDWVTPSPSNPVKVKNKNRLMAEIFLNSNTKTLEKDINGYYTTYVRINGQTSGAVAYYKVRYKSTEDVIVERMTIGEYNIKYSLADPSVVKYEPGKGLLTFYIDNISNYGYNYAGIMAHAWPQCIPGEPVTLYASSSIENNGAVPGIKYENCFHDFAKSSLFEKLEESIDAGTGEKTYTAKISNSRHLENLSPYISRLSSANYKITSVVLTDNIYWEDNGTYGTDYYSADTMPYLTELPDSFICFDTEGGDGVNRYPTDINSIMPIYSISNADKPTFIADFDGQNHTMYRFRIGYNKRNTGGNAGLFSDIQNGMTIKNLNMYDATVSPSITEGYGGLLVAASYNTLNVENVGIQGSVILDKKPYLGSVVGYGTTVNATNLKIDADMAVGASKLTTFAGGVAGHVTQDLNIYSSYIKDNALTIDAFGQCNAGGIAGKIDNNFVFNNSYIDSIAFNVTASYTSGGQNAGGLAGYVGGESTIETSKLICTNAKITCGSGKSNAGGYIGYANGYTRCNNSQILINTVFDVDITSAVGDNAYVGGFIGYVATDLKLENQCNIISYGDFKLNCLTDYPDYNIRRGYAGGFAGHVQNKVECYDSMLSISRITSIISNYVSGGLFGDVFNYADIQRSFVKAITVNIEGNMYIGGVIGSFSGTYNPGTLKIDNSGISAKYGRIKLNGNGVNAVVAGFIAQTNRVGEMNITDSFSAVIVDSRGGIGTDSPTKPVVATGGFGGFLHVLDGGSGTISGCYASAHTLNNNYDVISNAQYIGGFSGAIFGNITISDCFVSNRVQARDTYIVPSQNYIGYIGGFVGEVGKGVTIKQGCYTVGRTYGANNTYTGAFIGHVTDGTSIETTYYVDHYNYYYNQYYYFDLPAIGKNDTSVSYNMIKGISDRDNVIYWKDPITLIGQSVVFDGRLNEGTGIGKGYPYTNLNGTRIYYGDWIKPYGQ